MAQSFASSQRSQPFEVRRFDDLGIAVFEQAFASADIAQMAGYFPRLSPRTAGARADAFTAKAHAWIAHHDGLSTLAAQLLQTPARQSRIQAFDKSPAANWFVPWHQDRAENGVERPVAALERTIALRIHLDDCDESNGPLEVIPDSHRQGRLDAQAIARWTAQTSSLLCLAARGDVLAMRPLIIHRSQRARICAARRVVHLEYTAL